MLVKILDEMCRITRIPMTRIKVSFMLQKLSQCMLQKPRMEKLLLAARETSVSRHNGGPIESPP